MHKPCSRCGFDELASSAAVEPQQDAGTSLSTGHPNYLLTNEATDSQMLLIKNQIESARRDLILHDELIAALTKKRAETLETLRSLTSIAGILHIRRLPAELLAVIFYQFVMAQWPADHRYTNYSNFSVETNRGAWPLTRICRRWRNIALCEPRLWSFLSLCILGQSNPGANSSPGFLELMKLYLMNSREHSLNLSITIRSSQEPVHSDFLTVLCSQSNRWRDITLHLSPSYLPYLSAIKGHLQILERVNLHLDWDPEDDLTMHEPFDSFLVAPKLREVELRSLPNHILISLSFPWHQITRLHLFDKSDTSAWADSLALCSKLEELFIYIYSNDSDLKSPILLPSLRKLYWRGLPSRLKVLDVLQVPSLEELVIRPTSSVLDLRIGASITAMIQHSGCSLKMLRLEGNILLHKEVLDFLSAVPTITELRIHDGCYEDRGVDGSIMGAVLSRLTCDVDNEARGTCLLPNLEVLHMEIVMSFDTNLLVKMIDSRSEPSATVSGLRSFSLTAYDSEVEEYFASRSESLTVPVVEGYKARDYSDQWNFQ